MWWAVREAPIRSTPALNAGREDTLSMRSFLFAGKVRVGRRKIAVVVSATGANRSHAKRKVERGEWHRIQAWQPNWPEQNRLITVEKAIL